MAAKEQQENAREKGERVGRQKRSMHIGIRVMAILDKNELFLLSVCVCAHVWDKSIGLMLWFGR